jgi:hypothetical protein
VSVKRIALIGAVLGVLALTAVACGDDDNANGTSGGAASREELQKTQVISAMIGYRVEGLHEIDNAAQEATAIDPVWNGKITRMRQVTAGVDWPDEFADTAATLESELGMTSEAIDAEDLRGVKEHIVLAHAAWHGFEEQAYAFIAGEDTAPSGDHGESATPMPMSDH